MTVLIILASFFVTIFAEIPAPYPASGWRPQGQQFSLPSRQNQQQYGAPSHQYATPNNQYGAPNNQYGQPNNQFSASNNQNSAPNNQYGAPVNQNPPSEQAARNFGENNFASNRVNLNPNYDSQNTQNSFNNQQNRNIPQSSYNGNNPIDENRFRQQQNNQFGRFRQNQNEEFPRNDFGASNVDFQSARRPFNNQQSQNEGNRNLDENLSDETNEQQILLNEDGQDDLPNKNNRDSERKYGTPTTTQRSTRGRKPERTTPTPITTTEETETDLEQPNNVAVSTAVAGSGSTGQYYILQPDGRLQRVVFMTSEDKTNDKNAAFIANIMYETVEPLKGPIYSYSADNQLVRIN